MTDQPQGETAEGDLPPLLAPEDAAEEDLDCEHYTPADIEEETPDA